MTVPVQLNWRFLSYFAIAWFAFWIWIATKGMDAFVFVGIFVVLPILLISVLFIVWMIDVAITRGYRRGLPVLISLVILLLVPGFFFFYERQYPFAVRETATWLASSGKYKNEVQAGKISASGELKHIEWDISGPAFATTTVYLVFDPSDSLAAAAKSRQPGKFLGLPCKVYQVRRLESRWYAIVFYVGETWDDCT